MYGKGKTYVAPARNISVDVALPNPDMTARNVPVENRTVRIRGVLLLTALQMTTGIKSSKRTRINTSDRASPALRELEYMCTFESRETGRR